MCRAVTDTDYLQCEDCGAENVETIFCPICRMVVCGECRRMLHGKRKCLPWKGIKVGLQSVPAKA